MKNLLGKFRNNYRRVGKKMEREGLDKIMEEVKK